MRPFNITIPAGGNDRFDCAGSRLLLCDASSLATFNVRIDQGEDIPFKEGRKYIHSGGDFKLVEIINTDPVNPLTVSLLAGAGEVSDNSVYVQSIQQIVQTVNVEDAPLLAENVLVKAAVQAIEALLQNNTALRTPLTTLAGATYAEVSTATTTEIVSAAANVNGVIIRLGECDGAASSVSAAILVDDNPICKIAGFAGFNFNNQIRDVFVPAGSSLKLYSSAVTARAAVWYEVL